ncbi:uncharacterized protein LOC123008244 [Tribolium madens]|uniref:uncharacterized protein LOC123008244 n=1 Tax=Tribolium madens TaxID=41895 RepID=UPI001CF7556C|nr:uncharacterized protein LOC123008244 [Tribolium madens]
MNLTKHLLLFLLLSNVIVANCHLEKRDVHRIIIQEESRRPKRHKHRYEKQPKNHSFENFSVESYESIKDESGEDFKRNERKKNPIEILVPPWSENVDNFPDFTFNQKFVDLTQYPIGNFKLVAIPESTYEVRENLNEGGGFHHQVFSVFTTPPSSFLNKPLADDGNEKRTSNRGRKRKPTTRQRSKKVY